jgi:hypothetical protein
MKRKAFLALLTGLLAVGLYVGNILATPPSGLTTSTVAKASFDPLQLRASHTPPISGGCG